MKADARSQGAPPPTGGPTGGRRSDIRGRFPVEPRWPAGGASMQRAFDRNFDVQWQTGQPVSTVWPGHWSRGALWRMETPTLNIPPRWPMYDPTNPAGYHQPQH